MRDHQEDTPPSSVNGDEIIMDEDEVYEYDDNEYMEEEEELVEVDMNELMEMLPPDDHAALVFDKHQGSVFTCDIHPEGKLVASGGEDDKAYVWSADTGNVVMESSGFKDSVVFVGFSFDGVYFAAADMSGVIKVWKCNTETEQPWSLAFEYECDDITSALWHYGARVLICMAVTGDIYVFKIPSGETKVLQGHNVKVECGKLFNDGIRLAAGYEDGAVKIWDLKTSTVVHHVPANVHQNRITALDIHPESNLVASISTDGKVAFTNSNNGKVVGQMDTEKDLETLAFSQESQSSYLALGTLTGAVSIWDVTRQMLRHQCSKADEEIGGVTKMTWIKNHLVTACLDGAIRVYESKSGESALTLTGHRSEVLDMCYNAKQNIIVTTSDDGTARIYKYEINKDKD